MTVEKVSGIEITDRVRKVHEMKLECKLSKEEFKQISANNATIKMAGNEYKALIKARPLIKYRPLKNSFAKRVDRGLLAEGLNIPEEDVEKYIQAVIDKNFDENYYVELSNCKKTIKQEEINMARAYVYRHGKQEQVLSYFDNELTTSGNALKTMYETLNDEISGIASYYYRPCHPLSSDHAKTMYDIIKKHIAKAHKEGKINEEVALKTAQDALDIIIKIQDNPDVRQAFRFAWNKAK